MLGRKSREDPEKNVVLSDKEQVLQICKDAKLHSRKDKKSFVVEVNKKVIASGKNEDVVWKRALRTLL